MELTPRYKHTEIGVIPSDWHMSSLLECSAKITDGEHLTPSRSESGYFLLSARNILNGRIDLGDVDFVGANEYSRIRRRCDPDAGDVLISCSGTVGRVAVVPPGLECVMVRSAALVKPNPALLSGRYAQYFLQSSAGQRQIMASLNQGAQANLFLNHIQRLRLSLPPSVAEQEAISTALTDADALIESLEQLLAKKRLIKQGTKRELLTGAKRLPGFGRPWREVRLHELGLFLKGHGVRRDKSQSGNLPCVRYGELYTSHTDYIKEFHSWISPKVAASAMPIRYGDILFAGSGETKAEIGRCAALVDEVEAYAGGDILILRTQTGDPLFLGCLLNMPQVTRQKAARGQGDAIVHIKAAALAEIELVIPDPDEQSAIAGILRDMDSELIAIEARLAKARLIKQGMMQNLLTGKIRLV